jgi:hypothetical protein
MKRILGACLVLALAVFLSGAAAFAADAPAKKAAPAAKAAKATPPPTKQAAVTGEIVDLGCYFGHGASGASHKECAATCIANGGPMGLLTDKGMLYVLTMNHDKMDAFNEAKKHAGEKVEISGASTMKMGTRALEVNGVKAI